MDFMNMDMNTGFFFTDNTRADNADNTSKRE